MKILIKDSGLDPVQTQIDKIQRAIGVYSSHLEWYDDRFSIEEHVELLRRLKNEVENLDVLKSTHPEYFI